MFTDAIINMEGYPVKFLFTTYDNNRYGYPYYYNSIEGTIHYSKELTKIGTLYFTDYYSLIYSTIDDFGEISLNLGSIDSDNNGIDDICEKAKSINTNVSGNWYSHTNQYGNISGTVFRRANSQRGFYNMTITNTWAGDIPASGDFYIGVLSGNVNYSTSNHSITIDYSTTWDRQLLFEPFKSSYEILDINTVKVIGKDQFPTTNFTRTDDKYSATIELLDGDNNTFWQDYQKWLVVILDSNDSDADGIPDLSDTEDNRKQVNLSILPLLLE
jgi:hypothetical protein